MFRCPRARQPAELLPQELWSEPWSTPTAPESPGERVFRAAVRSPGFANSPAVLAPLSRTLLRRPSAIAVGLYNTRSKVSLRRAAHGPRRKINLWQPKRRSFSRELRANVRFR